MKVKKQFDFRKMSFYQIWTRSFCDGNGDGIGDLYGVYNKLEYIRSLGVDGIWFSPIYPSPNADYGYDISDYKNIHPDYGTLDQFKKVLDRAHELGMKVLLDLVINHTSDEHPWFIESCKGKDNPYSDYYIWRDPIRIGGKAKKEISGSGQAGSSAEPADRFKKEQESLRGRKIGKTLTGAADRSALHLLPNNWFSQFEGKAWEYNTQRDQYYLHIFAHKQPDLNMDNPKVREEVKEIMRFWLDMGVDGFREDVITFISKEKEMPDGISFLPAINGLPFYNEGPHLHDYLEEFRQVAMEYGAVQIGEAPFTGVRRALTYVGGRERVLDMMIQFETMMADCFMTEYVHHGFWLWKLKHAFSKWQYGFQKKEIGIKKKRNAAGKTIGRRDAEEKTEARTNKKRNFVEKTFRRSAAEEKTEVGTNKKRNAFAKFLSRRADERRINGGAHSCVAWNALYLENHDHPRVVSRYGNLQYWRESGSMLAAAYILQRGTPFLYQGQEIGMTNIALNSIDKYIDVAAHNAYNNFFLSEPVYEQMKRIHVSTRDSSRTPMQWSSSPQAGFTTGKPWFRVNPNYSKINVETEEKDPDSILNFYRKCLALRKKEETLLWGEYREYFPLNNKIFMYDRTLNGEKILVVCSFSDTPLRYRLPRHYCGRGIFGRPDQNGACGRECGSEENVTPELLLDNYPAGSAADSGHPLDAAAEGTGSPGLKAGPKCPGILRPYEVQVWKFRD